MVKIINGMNAKNHLGKYITCPDCGGKLLATERHWCGARNNAYDTCKLRYGTVKNNGLSEYSNADTKTKWCREHRRCNHDLDDEMVAPYWMHIGDKEDYKNCVYHIEVHKPIIDLMESFMDYIGDKHITWNMLNPDNINQRVIDNYGFCINIKSFEKLYEGYGSDLIYVMAYDTFVKYTDRTRKSLFKNYSDKEGEMIFLKRDGIGDIKAYIINRHNRNGEYKMFPLTNFEQFLGKLKYAKVNKL